MSYSSCGEAVGGNVASCGPAGVAFRTCGGGDETCGAGIGMAPADAIAPGGGAICGGDDGDGAGSLPASVERSSGAPAARPPGAPTGVPLFWPCSGVAITASLPSVRGAPGALGFRFGSKTSERRPGVDCGAAFPGPMGAACAGGAAPPLEPSCWKRYSVSSCTRLSCISSC